ncbi:MAG: hypothetical protein K8S97_03685, partial [Anaerolineae bacterium]|nr:hypothetical protein [Anaerolineae bacterium]
MLAVLWIVLRALASPGTDAEAAPAASSGQGLATALGITFFALMGMAIDQPGNVIYNQPIEWLFCPSGSELQRGVNITNPLPGRTDIKQDFSCVDTVNGQREIVGRPGMLEVIATRFVEYVLLGYALMALSRVYSAVRRRFSSRF